MSVFGKIKEWYQKKKQGRLETALQMCGIDPRRRVNAKPLDTEYPFGGVYESMDEFEKHVAELREKSQLNDFPFFCPARGTIVVIRDDSDKEQNDGEEQNENGDGQGEEMDVYTVWVWDGEKLIEMSDVAWDVEIGGLEDKLGEV